jgi:hypothetical protein
MLGEDRTYIPTAEIQVWWNLDPDIWYSVFLPTPSPAGPGTAQLLGGADVSGLCSYEVAITIPNVPVGEYGLVVVYFTPEGAAAAFPGVDFRVT